MYQLQSRLTDLLNHPLLDRIKQLNFCVENAPLKDLQAFYSTLVHHIFGGHENIGWGLRAVTDKNYDEFKLLYEFFNPHSAFFRLIYRLLKDTIKFEIAGHELPTKLLKMLESGRYSSFYTSLLNVDNFQHRNVSLTLNAFDFFMFHFVIHGMKNLHKVSPAAMAVNSENTKTVYFSLVADYLCNFLPNDPASIIYPQIECSPVKASTSLPLPTTQPIKKPKYLLLSALSHHQIQSPTSPRDLRLPEAVRSSTWRSESVMMIFIDCWLRYDVEESWELPSNEFIRVARILVKQLHFFGNVAEQDLTSLAVLRQQAQPLLNLRLYPFLKTIISRWPLDTSFLNVLELWLSYIQPWRYVYNRNIQILNTDLDDIPKRFKTFINENIVCYTQIFVRLIPRFMKMDLMMQKNAFMLFRLLKVIRNPSNTIREIERVMMNNSTVVVSSQPTSFHDTSVHSSPKSLNISFNRSGDRFSPHPHRAHQSGIEDSNYIYMFGEESTMQVYELMQRLHVANVKTLRDIEVIEKEMKKKVGLWDRLMRFIGWLSSADLSLSQALEEKRKTPAYLDFCLNSLSPVFNIQIEDTMQELTQYHSYQEDSDDDISKKSDLLNITPSFMKQQLHNITYTGDPALLPIMNHEIKFLVRLLHVVSCKLNEMFGEEFEGLFNRQDIYGKLSRQILSPPVEVRLFNKSAGFSQLEVTELRPRLSLRKMASRQMIMMFVLSFLFGRLFLGVSSLGFMTFAMFAIVYLLVKALFFYLNLNCN